ncbi:MAG: DUF1932 domain-containing protein [Desulfosporosinus sp.]|nr:DUF1932 domain-containing protein [Desulfosporosinus sp.]
MTVKVGFIGFGEVASFLSERLLQNGCSEVYAYDVLLNKEGGIKTIESRARVTGIRFADFKTVVENTEYVLSTVVTQVAVPVAEECVTFLKAGQVYIDLNSTAPSVKVNVSEIIKPSGAVFVEGAILGALGATGADTKILLGGEQAEDATAVLEGLGLRTSVFSSEIGKASTFKMLRSIFSKGMEAMLIELLLAGQCAGIDKELWLDIVETMSKTPFEKTAANWVQTHAPACERRYHEMEQVIETMKEIGVDPILTIGTTNFLKRSSVVGLNKVLTEKPGTMNEVIGALKKLL